MRSGTGERGREGRRRRREEEEAEEEEEEEELNGSLSAAARARCLSQEDLGQDLEEGRGQAEGSPQLNSVLEYLQRHRHPVAVLFLVTPFVTFFFIIFYSDLPMSSGDKTWLWLRHSSDLLICACYFLIPFALMYVSHKRKDLSGAWHAIWMFGSFTVSCGTTHAISTLSPWVNITIVQTLMKLFTAGISFATAIIIYKLIPVAFLIPSIEDLEREIRERKMAERQLQLQYRRSVMLSKITSQIRKSLNAEDIWNTTAQQLAALFDICRVSIYLLHTSNEEDEDADVEGEKSSADFDLTTDEDVCSPSASTSSLSLRRRRKGKGKQIHEDKDKYDEEKDPEDEEEEEEANVIEKNANGKQRTTRTTSTVATTGQYQKRHEGRKRSYPILDFRRRSAVTEEILPQMGRPRAGSWEGTNCYGITADNVASSSSALSLQKHDRSNKLNRADLVAEHLHHSNTNSFSTDNIHVPLALIPGMLTCEGVVALDMIHTDESSSSSSTFSPHPAIDPQVYDAFRTMNVLSALCLSIPYSDHAKAVIVLQECCEAKQWTEDEVKLLEEVAVQVEIGLAQARLLVKQQKQYQMMRWQNEELEAARRSAEKANKAKSDFLAMVSHEIRTPMNAIIGMTTVLQDTELSEDQRECASIIMTSCRSLLSLVNTILDFSKIEAGKTVLQQYPFDFHRCVLKAVALMTGNIDKDKDLKLVCHPIPAALPHVMVGDKHRLRQILINLLSNALKFTLHGEVSVKTEVLRTWYESKEKAHPPKRNQAEEDGEDVSNRVDSAFPTKHFEVQISVKDTGIGIPPDRMHCLFQMFSQVDSSLTRKFEGTGLGLVISKKLCEMMGGNIKVQSEVGKGSTFTFTVHLVQASVMQESSFLRKQFQRVTSASSSAASSFSSLLPEISPPSPSSASSRPFTFAAHSHLTSLTSDIINNSSASSLSSALKPKPIQLPSSTRILLAEDNKVNQKVAMQLLKRLGLYNVDIVSDGQQALDAVVAASHTVSPYHVVFMDLHMPTMDGFTSCKLIRDHFTRLTARKDEEEEEAEVEPFIVACTANLQSGVKKNCNQAGMNYYISKPIRSKELAVALDRASAYLLQHQSSQQQQHQQRQPQQSETKEEQQQERDDPASTGSEPHR
ncbi:MHYT domain-containing protein, NO-binding membrane sensor [Balamuthia mandrillaris]